MPAIIAWCRNRATSTTDKGRGRGRALCSWYDLFRAPAAVFGGRELEIELKVDAGTDHALGELDRVACRHAAVKSATARRVAIRAAAEIDVEIFDLGGPILGKGAFDAGTGGPAGIRAALATAEWSGRPPHCRRRRRRCRKTGRDQPRSRCGRAPCRSNRFRYRSLSPPAHRPPRAMDCCRMHCWCCL